MSHSDPHHPYRLTILAVFLGITLLLGGIFSPSGKGPFALPYATLDAMASVVGMGAGVPPNEYNTLSQSLADKEKALSEREALLQVKENAIAQAVSDDVRRDNMRLLLLVGSALLVLFGLIGTNFYFDWKRGHDLSGPARGIAHGTIRTVP